MCALGLVLMSWATCGFFNPYNLILGGATGIGIILRHLWGLPLWLSNLIINLPLFIWAAKVYNKGFVLASLGCTLGLSLGLVAFERLPPPQSDYFTAVVFGGIIYGLGIGMVLAAGATTGGSDLAAGIISRLYPGLRLARVMLVIDGIIIALGMGVFGTKTAMYGIVAVTLVTKGADLVLEGFGFAKAVFIVTEQGQALAQAIMEGMVRGVTLLPALGGYSGRQKSLILVAVQGRQVAALKALVQARDKAAFILITDIREVVGYFRQ